MSSAPTTFLCSLITINISLFFSSSHSFFRKQQTNLKSLSCTKHPINKHQFTNKQLQNMRKQSTVKVNQSHNNKITSKKPSNNNYLNSPDPKHLPPPDLVCQPLNISASTVRRISASKCERVCQMKYTTKQNPKLERIQLAKTIINDIIPIKSGRSYRVQIINNKELYNRYCKQVTCKFIQKHVASLPRISKGKHYRSGRESSRGPRHTSQKHRHNTRSTVELRRS